MYLLLGHAMDPCCAGVAARLDARGLSARIVVDPLAPPARLRWRLDHARRYEPPVGRHARQRDCRSARARHGLARSCRLGQRRPRLHASRAARRLARVARRSFVSGHQPARRRALVSRRCAARRVEAAPPPRGSSGPRGRDHERSGRGRRVPAPPCAERRQRRRLQSADRRSRLSPRRRWRVGATVGRAEEDAGLPERAARRCIARLPRWRRGDLERRGVARSARARAGAPSVRRGRAFHVRRDRARRRSPRPRRRLCRSASAARTIR